MIQAKNVHIVGIGGIGTSAAAKWFLHQGATVSGSDMQTSHITEELGRMGAQVKVGHFADNLPRECELILYSAAVPATNPERQMGKEWGIPELSYPQFLGELAKEKKTIAISGTNGKSTTTAMIAKILIEAGYNPTVILGTRSPDLAQGNFHPGGGDWFVVEACEHMANMLNISADILVITNIEEDHLDFYKDINDIRGTFQKWIDGQDHCKAVVTNARDTESMALNILSPRSFVIQNREVAGGRQTFDVAGVPVELAVPGVFNAQNAAAALTAAHAAGVQDDIALKALREFKGTWRRFEHVGVWEGADVYSDYAHHPTAIAGLIAGVKEQFADRRVLMVFEPHQHSRTHELFNEFSRAFDGLGEDDILIVSEIYEVAGRTEEKFESSEDLVKAIESDVKAKVLYAEDLDKAENHLRNRVKSGDLVLIVGAGPVDSIARNLAS